MWKFVLVLGIPLLLIASESDPNYPDQARFVGALQKFGIEHRFRRFPGMTPDFMTAFDDGSQPANWRASRDAAWSEVIAFIEERVPLVEGGEAGKPETPPQ